MMARSGPDAYNPKHEGSMRSSPKEIKVYFVTCPMCDWESDAFEDIEELPSSCKECGFDGLTLKTEWTTE